MDENAKEIKKKSGRHLTPAEQLESIAKRQKALAARARAVRAKINVKERKERAHRLIEIGATVEAAAGAMITKNALPFVEAFLRAHRDQLAAALARADKESG